MNSDPKQTTPKKPSRENNTKPFFIETTPTISIISPAKRDSDNLQTNLIQSTQGIKNLSPRMEKIIKEVDTMKDSISAAENIKREIPIGINKETLMKTMSNKRIFNNVPSLNTGKMAKAQPSKRMKK